MKNHATNSIWHGKHWLVLPLGLFASVCHAANTLAPMLPAGIDVSAWACRYCDFEPGYSSEVEAGIGFVSGDSYKFGEYTGLTDKGFFMMGNATARYRDDRAGYFNFTARDLGIESRSLELEGGRQGSYRLFLNYQEIPHYIAHPVKTPYLGNGSDTLQLPTGWITAGSTTTMTGLMGSLRDETLKTRRQRLSAGASINLASHWQTTVEFHHEVRDGQIAGAGSFFFNSAQLVLPVDYVTNEAQVSLSYVKRLWQMKIAYYGSFFTNHDSSLTWQNAYTPLVAGAASGQLALPPSNLFHQLLLSGGYQLNQRSRFTGNVAIGRMEQDKSLLAATTNSSLAVSLPETSANARVDTLSANLKLNSQLNNKLHLSANYRYNDRDNKTPSLLFNWVTTDTFTANARRNLPYSFTDQSLHLNADYRFDRKMKLGAGYELTKKDRTHQEVDHTREDTLWARAGVHARRNVDLDVRFAHAKRDASGYNPVNETDPPQNLLLRKYNMADRNRDSGSMRIGINTVPWAAVEMSTDLSHDRYQHSVLGLTASRDLSVNADVSFSIGATSSLHIFAGRERIISHQDGSQSYSVADWFARNDDRIDSLGAGLKRQFLKGRMSVGGDYLLSHSVGRISVDSGASGADFPELKTDLISVKLYADYHLSENMVLHVNYWYENYHVSDWQHDGLYSNTVSNVVGFGDYRPDYDVRAVMGTLRYRF